MRLGKPSPVLRGSRAAGAALTALLGFVLLASPLGRGLSHLSYDLLFFFRHNIPVDDAVIIYMDEVSEERLHTGRWERWERSLHADLLDKLAAAGARTVVFDALFFGGTNLVANERLVRAAKAYGKTVVAAKVTPRILDGEVIGSDLSRPFEALADVAAWGVVEVAYENKAAREHFRDLDFDVPSLAWQTARTAQGRPPPDPFAPRWINFYGPPWFIRYFSYADVLATNFAAGPAFSNKVVFVGASWSVGFTGGKGADEFLTPYTRWTGRRSPGVEIVATASLNLMRGDWLRRLPPVIECLVVLITGTALGWGLAARRPLAAAAWAVLAALLVSAATLLVVWPTRVWFPWLIVAGAQVPCAVGWSVLIHTQRLLREKKMLEHRLALAGPDRQPQLPSPAGIQILEGFSPAPRAEPPAPLMSPATAAAAAGELTAAAPPFVPDHDMLRRIGHGAYGEVWLARDILGSFHAAKIVYRSHFQDAGPYEREFNGLKRFTPISRSHPGLVNILHVGRNPNPEYIYYVMEAGDDLERGPHIVPETYVPKTLAKELARRKRLPLAEALRLSADLAAALEFLHQQQLIHRDLKPSNILFVRDVPKLADIGLVTGIATDTTDVSFVGTHGYIPPEGPGTPAADVFSLGKVIYEAAFGMPCAAFPALPATLLDREKGSAVRELNLLILKACANDPEQRFRTAAELCAALNGLRQRLG